MTGTVVAGALAVVSPSRLRALRECALRVAFSQASTTSGAQSDAQLIGDAAHAALAAALSPGPPFRARLETLTADFLSTLEAASGGRAVRRARPAAARLKVVARRAIFLIEEAGPAAEILAEQRLSTKDGRLVGVVDLIVTSPTLSAIVDFKTGAVLDEEGELAQHLQDQLALYCYLEHERSGTWPTQALILRFGGSPVEWSVDPAVCRAIADEARALMDTYANWVGTSPPASPSERACRFCAFAPKCQAFWDAFDPTWAAPAAVEGRIKWIEESSAGGATIQLSEATGTQTGEIVIRQLQLTAPNRALVPGALLRAVGLWVDESGQMVAGNDTRIWVTDGLAG